MKQNLPALQIQTFLTTERDQSTPSDRNISSHGLQEVETSGPGDASHAYVVVEPLQRLIPDIYLRVKAGNVAPNVEYSFDGRFRLVDTPCFVKSKNGWDEYKSSPRHFWSCFQGKMKLACLTVNNASALGSRNSFNSVADAITGSLGTMVVALVASNGRSPDKDMSSSGQPRNGWTFREDSRPVYMMKRGPSGIFVESDVFVLVTPQKDMSHQQVQEANQAQKRRAGKVLAEFIYLLRTRASLEQAAMVSVPPAAPPPSYIESVLRQDQHAGARPEPRRASRVEELDDRAFENMHADMAANVEAITPEPSLPDPAVTSPAPVTATQAPTTVQNAVSPIVPRRTPAWAKKPVEPARNPWPEFHAAQELKRAFTAQEHSLEAERLALADEEAEVINPARAQIRDLERQVADFSKRKADNEAQRKIIKHVKTGKSE